MRRKEQDREKGDEYTRNTPYPNLYCQETCILTLKIWNSSTWMQLKTKSNETVTANSRTPTKCLVHTDRTSVRSSEMDKEKQTYYK